jgi:hypothetical protein
MSSPLVFTPDRFADSFRQGFAELSSLGVLPERVDSYLRDRGEVDPGKVTRNVKRLADRMVQQLASRGVKLENAIKFNNGGYDEILYTAYDRAIGLGAESDDPLDNVRAGQNAGVDGWDFNVETFANIEDQGIVRESILAAGAIDYVYELGERMGIFRLTEALVLNWASGAIDVSGGQAAGKLYRYWKLMDDRSDENDRGLLYKRVLNKGSVELVSRMVANEYFPQLWSNLMNEVATFIDKTERLETGRTEATPVSTGAIVQSIKELQYNLSEYCNGMAFMQIRELYSQLQQAFDLLRDPDIIAHFGGPRRRNMWTAVEQMSKQEFQTAVPVGPLLRVAVDGNRVFRICSTFDEGTFPPDQLMGLIDACESYIINSATVDSKLGNGANGVGNAHFNDFDSEDGFSDEDLSSF